MSDNYWYRLIRRRLREAIADNQWLLPTTGAAVGLLLALLIGTGVEDETSWTVTVDRSRDTLMSALALVFTALSIVLALASVAAQNVVSRFGSRVLRIYTRRSADRWVIGVFTMAATFILVEQFQLRDLDPEGTAPVAGLTISVIMLVLAGSTMIWYIASILRWFRVDQAVQSISEATRQAVQAVARDRRNAATGVEIPVRPSSSTDLSAPASGHLTEIDTESVLEVCRDRVEAVVITCGTGDAVVRCQPIGWIESRGGHEITISIDELAELIDVSGTRELGHSIEYGLVALVDMAIMALSPAVNDPNTAVEVIETMSFLFAEIADAPLGPYAVPDTESRPRVVVASRTFGQLVELATKQIILYGLSDPYVAAALERFADSLELLDLDDHDQAYVDAFADSLETVER